MEEGSGDGAVGTVEERAGDEMSDESMKWTHAEVAPHHSHSHSLYGGLVGF